MKGTIVNSAAIILGSIVGILFNRRIPDKVKTIALQALGLSTILIGITMGVQTKNILIVVFSVVIGGVIGTLLNLEKRLESIGEYLKKRVKSKDGKFVTAFVSTSILFCVGAMAIVGSIEDGLAGNASILYTKAILDGTISVAFSGTMGIGVLFSFIPVLVYQGAITILAQSAKQFLTQPVITELTATGGLLLIAIGLNILEIKKIPVGNLLPGLFVAIILGMIFL